MFRTFLLSTLDLLNLIVIGAFWYKFSGPFLVGDIADQSIAFGRLFGLVGSYLLIRQLLLIGRVKWIEGLYGFDRLSAYHRYNGFLIYFLVLAHVAMVFLGYASKNQIALGEQVFKFSNIDAVSLGFVGFVLLVLVTFVSARRRKFSYETWYNIHLLVYLIIPFVLFHQLGSGYDLSQIRDFAGYWIGLYVFVIVNYIIYRFIKPALLVLRHRFVVDRVEKENDEVWSVYVKGRKLDKFKFDAGQFARVRFLARGFWREAHPFSISSAPNDEFLRFTIKNLGDFTSKIRGILPGTRMSVDGPHGVFRAGLARTGNVLLIAGGIGITPIMAIIEKFLQQRKDVALMYCHKFEKDGVFIDELENLSNYSGLKVFHVISRGEATIGEKGRVSKERIRRLIPDVANRDVYICGPVSMMDDTVRAVCALGVPANRIHTERFTF